MARKRTSAEPAAIQQEQAPAPPPAPMGMVRIGKGKQQRCIWPVHLSGWQQLGWRPVTLSAAVALQPSEALSNPVAAADDLEVKPPPGHDPNELDADGWLSDLTELH